LQGGASSVGSSAIQLAVAAGYEVITTASPKNFDYVKKLGASQVFDYKSPTVVSDLLDAFEGKTSLGAFDTIGSGAWELPVEFVQKSKGAKFVVTVTHGWQEDHPKEVTMKQAFAPSIKGNHVGKAVFEDYLPKALKNGTFVTAPEPLIAGKGLQSLQMAVDLQRRGVSARKVIVLL
jgi:NADPH:quinone reductase-like Zn-dependent oxidoreductase